MGLKNLFHKIKTGFARLSGKSIPNISSTKRSYCQVNFDKKRKRLKKIFKNMLK